MTVSRLCSVGEFSGSCAIAAEGSQLMKFPQKKLLLLGHLSTTSLTALILSLNIHVRSMTQQISEQKRHLGSLALSFSKYCLLNSDRILASHQEKNKRD